MHDSYEALIDDPEVEAVYNPLPNGLHGKWTIAALEAGKHVLCEKPFTANTEEAEKVAAVAAASPGLVVMEAFHYRYHPLVARLLEIIASGELGQVAASRPACASRSRCSTTSGTSSTSPVARSWTSGATRSTSCGRLASAEPEVVSAAGEDAVAGGRPVGEGRDALRRRPDRQHRVLDVVQHGRQRWVHASRASSGC